MELFFGGLKNLFSLLVFWLQALIEVAGGLSLWRLVPLTAAFFLCLFSGLAAAQIAERRGFAPHVHLLLGFIVPGIYPLLLLLVLRPRTGSATQVEQARQKAIEDKISAQTREEEKALQKKQAELAREEADPGYWPRDRVDRIRLNPDGSDAGPFILCLKDGRKLSARRITGTTPECAILELIGNGGQAESLRIPLTKIDSVRPAEP